METNECEIVKLKKKKKDTIKEKKKKGVKEKKAYGLIDRIINKLPEIHIPGYQYCGPGTDLEKRLRRGDPGINKLDAACKDHDIAYDAIQDSKDRRKADKELIGRAFKRVYSTDANMKERAAALLVSGLMSAKRGLSKIGLGLDGSSNCSRRRRKRKRISKRGVKRRAKRKKKMKKKKSIPFGQLVKSARASIKESKSKSLNLNDTIHAAIRSAKEVKRRGNTVKMPPRVLKLPKFGGSVLGILPILSGLSAIGSITASTVGIVNALKQMEKAKKQHITGHKIGRGPHLSYERGVKGYGFYLKPYHQH